MINRQRLRASGFIAAVVAVLLLYYFRDARTLPFPRCPLYLLTHYYCPGCGSQRALSALLHADFRQALRCNVLLVAFLPLLLYAGWHRLKPAASPLKLFYSPVFSGAVLAVVLLFWLLRNLPFFPFSLLAPGG